MWVHSHACRRYESCTENAPHQYRQHQESRHKNMREIDYFVKNFHEVVDFSREIGLRLGALGCEAEERPV